MVDAAATDDVDDPTEDVEDLNEDSDDVATGATVVVDCGDCLETMLLPSGT